MSESLQTDHRTSHKKADFRQAVEKNTHSVFTFMHYPKVRTDNNGLERAVGTVNVKTKVSGLFRIEKGETGFGIIRSVIGTTTKNTNNVFEALTLLTNLQPEW